MSYLLDDSLKLRIEVLCISCDSHNKNFQSEKPNQHEN